MTNYELVDVSEVNKKILDVQKAADRGETISEVSGQGVVLLKNYSKGVTGSGKPKYIGTVANIEEANFNVWNNSDAYEYFESLASGTGSHVVLVNYVVSKYGLVINRVSKVDGYDPDSFIHHKYSVKEVFAEFVSALKESDASENAMTIIRDVLHCERKDEVIARFIKEYAAYSHHDNCTSGLLAHTAKCLRIYNGIKGAYPFLEDTKTNDLMVIGLTLHDIGKIYEMHDGIYQNYSFITHRGLGLEHLLPYKAEIADLYDEGFFYMICSIILQHHGEYGEEPRTLYAALVHMIDDMEAQLTSVNEVIFEGTTTSDAAGTKIKVNGSYVNVLGM